MFEQSLLLLNNVLLLGFVFSLLFAALMLGSIVHKRHLARRVEKDSRKTTSAGDH